MDFATLANAWGPWVALAIFIIIQKWDSIMASIMTLIGRRQDIVENEVKAERSFDQKARNGLIESTKRNWEQQEWQRRQLEAAWRKIVMQADLAIERSAATERMIGSLVEVMKSAAEISRSQGARVTSAISEQSRIQEQQVEAIKETNKFLSANWFALANLQKHLGYEIDEIVQDAEGRLGE